jgi:hypothetical protein
MNEDVDLTALACSRLLHDRFPREYAATRARRAINLKSMPHGHNDLWLFIMLPDGPAVSDLTPPLSLLPRTGVTLMVPFSRG